MRRPTSKESELVMRFALTVNDRLVGFGERNTEFKLPSVGDLEKGSLEEEERK